MVAKDASRPDGRVPDPDCVLCTQSGGDTLWRDECLRVVLVGDVDYPGFCRVILNAHMREMTDLPRADCIRLMDAVFAVEAALRELLEPDKVNLASLGNQVPHLHWHVIPRFRDDLHFPNPVWGTPGAGRARELPPRFREHMQERLRSELSRVRP
jgi:diadenosine tetraphosphate (Ap4A) HIT family hydrolase